MSNVMKARRRALGMSQARLAEMAGVNARQIVRYEAGEQQPVIAVAAAIARALELPLSELAAEFDPVVDLSGRWWSGWEVRQAAAMELTVQETNVVQHNTTLSFLVDQTVPANHGAPGWRADIRLWDNEVLIGSYRRTDEGPRSWGTLLLVLQPDHRRAVGRWVGQSPTGEVVTGGSWLARDRGELERMGSVVFERSAAP